MSCKHSTFPHRAAACAVPPQHRATGLYFISPMGLLFLPPLKIGLPCYLLLLAQLKDRNPPQSCLPFLHLLIRHSLPLTSSKFLFTSPSPQLDSQPLQRRDQTQSQSPHCLSWSSQGLSQEAAGHDSRFCPRTKRNLLPPFPCPPPSPPQLCTGWLEGVLGWGCPVGGVLTVWERQKE